MSDPLPLDHTAFRLWPSRGAQFTLLLFAGGLIYFGISAFRQLQLDLAGRLWATGLLIIGVIAVIAQIRQMIVYRPIYILSRQGITIVNDHHKLIPWHEIEVIESYEEHSYRSTSHGFRIQLHSSSFIERPNRRSLIRRLFFNDPNSLTFSLDSLALPPDEAMDHIHSYHRHYADWPID